MKEKLEAFLNTIRTEFFETVRDNGAELWDFEDSYYIEVIEDFCDDNGLKYKSNKNGIKIKY